MPPGQWGGWEPRGVGAEPPLLPDSPSGTRRFFQVNGWKRRPQLLAHACAVRVQGSRAAWSLQWFWGEMGEMPHVEAVKARGQVPAYGVFTVASPQLCRMREEAVFIPSASLC